MKSSNKGVQKVRTLRQKAVPAADARGTKGGSSVSNVLKTRHDTAKNSIANVR